MDPLDRMRAEMAYHEVIKEKQQRLMRQRREHKRRLAAAVRSLPKVRVVSSSQVFASDDWRASRHIYDKDVADFLDQNPIPAEYKDDNRIL